MKHHRSHRQPHEDEQRASTPPSSRRHVDNSSSKSRVASSSRRRPSVNAAACLPRSSRGSSPREAADATADPSQYPRTQYPMTHPAIVRSRRRRRAAEGWCRRPEGYPRTRAEARSLRLASASNSASSYPCPPHRPHVCAMAIIGRRRRPGADFSSPSPSPSPGPDSSSPSVPEQRVQTSRQRGCPPSPSTPGPSRTPDPTRRSLPRSATNPSASFQSSALAIGDPRVPPPANLARFRSSLSSAPPSVVSVAVHDAKRDDILSASQPVPAPSSRTAASRARRRSHLSDSRYRPRTIAAGHTLPLQCDACGGRGGQEG